jgi:hypothetical protein
MSSKGLGVLKIMRKKPFYMESFMTLYMHSTCNVVLFLVTYIAIHIGLRLALLFKSRDISLSVVTRKQVGLKGNRDSIPRRGTHFSP